MLVGDRLAELDNQILRSMRHHFAAVNACKRLQPKLDNPILVRHGVAGGTML